MLRRIGVLTSVAVVAAMFAGVPSAHAQTAGVCLFTGVSGELTPDIQSIESDLLALTPLDIERGNYNFFAGGIVDGNAPCSGDLSANFATQGSYDNILCGTGFWHDLDGSHTWTTATGGRIGYEIPFVAGQGPMLIGPKGGRPSLVSLTAILGTDTVNSAAQQDPFNRPVTGDFTGTGFVNIVPQNFIPELGQSCYSQPVNRFVVTGFFILTDAQ